MSFLPHWHAPPTRSAIEEPFDSATVIRVANALYNRSGFADWRQVNTERKSLLYHLGLIDIPGIWTQLEDVRSDLEFHSELYVNRLSAAQFKAHVAARERTDTAEHAAQRVQNLVYALHHDWRSQRDPVRAMVDQAANYGMGIIRLDLSREICECLFPEEYKDEDDLIAKLRQSFSAGFSKNPIRLENPDIFACAWEEDASIVCEVGIKTYSAADLDREEDEDAWRYLTSDTRSDISPNTSFQNWGVSAQGERTVKVYHLETSNYIYDVFSLTGDISGYMAQCRPTLIGRPWYAFCVGKQTSERQPNERYRPLLATLYPAVQKRWLLGTLLNSGAFQTGRPVYQEVPVAGRAASTVGDWLQMPQQERPVLRFDIINDAIVKPREGFNLIPLAVPSAEWLKLAIDAADRDIQRFGFPPPLSPEPSEHAAASSGYQAAIQVEQSTLHIDPALQNIAAAEKQMALIAIEVIQSLGLPVSIPVHPIAQGSGGYLQHVTVKPDDFRDQEITIELTAKPATAEYQDKESDLRLLAAGKMSEPTFMRRHYDDPQDELERIDQDGFAKEVKEAARQTAMQIIMSRAAQIGEQVAGELGIPPIANPQPQPGGPTPGQPARTARPPGPAVPGLGAPQVPPEQAEPMQGAPQALGMGAAGVAP